MKILFLTWKDIKHPLAGGAEKVVYEYAKGLQKRGHEVTWFGYAYENSLKSEIIDGINIIRKYNLYNSYLLFPKYYKKNLANKYDLIIDEAGGLPFLSYRFEKNIPIIFFTHHVGDREWDHSFTFPLNIIGKNIYYRIYRQYKDFTTIAVSNSTKLELIDRFGYKSENISVINNACEVEIVDSVDFSQKQDRILYLGRLMPIKRVEHAILAFDRFIKSDKKFANYILDIVGNDQDEKYLSTLKNLISELGIKENVIFLGHIDRILYNDFMYKQKLILVTSIKEGFGLIVLEANSYGIPALGYDVSGLHDSISDGNNGYLINDGDYQAMGDKIAELLSNDELYENITNKSINHVKQLDKWDKKIDEFEAILLNKIKLYPESFL